MSDGSASTEVCWLSVDPVRRKVDFYPRPIAARIEKSYHERDPWAPSACVLGSDFFNATVHFHPSGSCYQTTPGMSMGRAGFKQPGYRSVKRVVKPADGSGRVAIYSKQVAPRRGADAATCRLVEGTAHAGRRPLQPLPSSHGGVAPPSIVPSQ